MHSCSCGEVTGGAGERCTRCAALQALDLDTGASEKQIREAYRVLVKVWHPDRFQGDQTLKQAAEDKLKALNTAYLFLTRKTAAGESRTRERPRPRVRKQPPAAPRPRMRRRGRFRFPTGAFLKLALLASCVLVAGVLLVAMDSFLASDPTTGRIYTGIRDGVAANVRQTVNGLWSQAGQ